MCTGAERSGMILRGTADTGLFIRSVHHTKYISGTNYFEDMRYLLLCYSWYASPQRDCSSKAHMCCSTRSHTCYPCKVGALVSDCRARTIIAPLVIREGALYPPADHAPPQLITSDLGCYRLPAPPIKLLILRAAVKQGASGWDFGAAGGRL